MKADIVYPFRCSFLDYPDNESSCISVYFKGCDFLCRGCHSSVLRHKQKDGTSLDFTLDSFFHTLQSMSKKYNTKKVVLLGGDPLSKENRNFTKQILDVNGSYEFCIYTGYTVEIIKDLKIKNFKYIKCGVYDETLKQKSEKTDKYFKLASMNQKLYDSNFNLLSKDGVYFFN